MAPRGLNDAKVLEVNRSDLRQNQSRWLKKACGQHVLLIKSNDAADEKVVLDKRYFDEIRKRLESLVETLEIAMDRRLFTQILAAADTLEEDVRLGKLHSAGGHLCRGLGVRTGPDSSTWSKKDLEPLMNADERE